MHTRSRPWITIILATLGSSACQSVISAMPDAGARIADSVADFSLVQGNGGWRYLYQEPGQPLKELGDIHGMSWWMDYETRWTNITSDSMHPNVDGKGDALGNLPGKGTEYAVRRWTADVTGSAEIEYIVAKDNTQCGDGVLTRILIDDMELVEHKVNFNDNSGFSGTLHAPLLVGSNVDLRLEPGADQDCDGTHFVAKIIVH